MLKISTALAGVLLAAAFSAHAQIAQPGSAANKPKPDPQPFYTPYTGPGFGNPDANAKEDQPVGKSRAKYHDAPGTSAYSRGGQSEPTQLNPPKKPKAAKKEKPKQESKDPAAASPSVSEKR